MSNLFQKFSLFNQPLYCWNVSSVTDMGSMFKGTLLFNEPLSIWDVSKVTNMVEMFCNSFSFNQPLDSWVVSSVSNMSRMFYQAQKFQQNLCSWYYLQYRSIPTALDMFYKSDCDNQSDPNFLAKTAFCGTIEQPNCQVSFTTFLRS